MQKIQTYGLSIGLLIIGLVPFAIQGNALAAAAKPGTCILADNQGQSVQKVGTCKSFLPSGKDANGAVLSATACYELSEHNSSITISQTLSCGNSRLSGAKEVLCTNGLLAPNNDAKQCTGSGTVNLGDAAGKYSCGGGPGNTPVHTTINFGCRGKGNAVMDMTFAIIRFLTTGVGLVLVGSMIYAGIQYTSSRGDPQATAGAVNRLRANVWALLLFLFGYAILNYIVPGALLK